MNNTSARTGPRGHEQDNNPAVPVEDHILFLSGEQEVLAALTQLARFVKAHRAGRWYAAWYEGQLARCQTVQDFISFVENEAEFDRILTATNRLAGILPSLEEAEASS
jgi:hypothetical protein